MKENEDWDFPGGNIKLDLVCVDGVVLQAGDRVRLLPQGRADAFDILLAGKTATIEAIEQDYEDRVYLAVVVDDDPGKEFGMMRKPAHRFFYEPNEVEPLAKAQIGPNEGGE